MAAGFTATLVTVPTAISVAATPDCAGVTAWSIDLPETTSYYFVKTGGGWVSSFNSQGTDPFGTVDLSVSGASFHVYNLYLASYSTDYNATFNGTLAANCTIGQSTPPGKWSSNHGSVGIFLASPLDQSITKHNISGTVTGSDGAPVAGVWVDVRNANGLVVTAAKTQADGHYQTIDLEAGQYSVELATNRQDFAPSVAPVSLVDASATVDFVAQPNALAIQFSAGPVPASGTATVKVTITDTAHDGTPVVGAKIVVEPPVEVGTDGVANGLVCDNADNLVSPVRLHDGSLLGQHFSAVTDGSGQVSLTLYVGTLGGSWAVDAYQPGRMPRLSSRRRWTSTRCRAAASSILRATSWAS